MRFQRIAVLAVLGTALFATSSLPAFEVGDWVAVRRDAKLIAEGQTVDQVVPGQVLRVLAVGSGQVWVSRGRPGWIATPNVVAIADAEKLFGQASPIRMGPGDYLARGKVRLATGKVELGIADLKRAAELTNQRVEFLEPLGFGYLAAGDPTSAMNVFTLAIQKQPPSANAWMGRGLAYGQLGRSDNAQADFTKAIELDPQHAFPRKHLGALLHDLGQLDAAEQSLRKAIELDAHDGFARKALGRLLFDQGQLEPARDSFTIAIKLDARDTEALTGRGVVRHAIGDLSGAEADYAAAIEVAEANSENAYLWSNLGQVQTELGKHRDALKNLNKAVELNAEFAEARSHRAFLMTTQSAAFTSSAAAIAQAVADMRVVTASPEPRTFWDYRSLALVSAQQGDRKQAADYQSQAVEQVQQNGPQRFVESAIVDLKRYQGQ